MLGLLFLTLLVGDMGNLRKTHYKEFRIELQYWLKSHEQTQNIKHEDGGDEDCRLCLNAGSRCFNGWTNASSSTALGSSFPDGLALALLGRIFIGDSFLTIPPKTRHQLSLGPLLLWCCVHLLFAVQLL